LDALGPGRTFCALDGDFAAPGVTQMCRARRQQAAAAAAAVAARLPRPAAAWRPQSGVRQRARVRAPRRRGARQGGGPARSAARHAKQCAGPRWARQGRVWRHAAASAPAACWARVPGHAPRRARPCLPAQWPMGKVLVDTTGPMKGLRGVGRTRVVCTTGPTKGSAGRERTAREVGRTVSARRGSGQGGSAAGWPPGGRPCARQRAEAGWRAGAGGARTAGPLTQRGGAHDAGGDAEGADGGHAGSGEGVEGGGDDGDLLEGAGCGAMVGMGRGGVGNTAG
jgi:hypothetical protein